MRNALRFIPSLTLSFYLFIVLGTNISLIGYWTDPVFSIILTLISLRIAFNGNLKTRLLTLSLRAITVSCSIVILSLIAINLVIPFNWDKLKTEAFLYQKIEGSIFNAYFKPVGAYSGGEGVFWITETPKHFPIIEIEKFYDGAILWDFGASEWEGEPINQTEIVKAYILDEVINKH